MRSHARARLLALPRSTKRLLMLCADLVGIPLSMFVAFVLKTERLDILHEQYGWAMLAALAVSIPIFAHLGLYRAVLRFMGAQVTRAVIVGVTLSVVLLAAVNAVADRTQIPYSILAIYWALALLYVGGTRMLLRSMLVGHRPAADAVIVYGAGEAGARLAASLLASRQFAPIAFVDDNAAMHGSLIHGIEVRPPAELPELVSRASVKRVLLAMPRLSRRRRREILNDLARLAVHVQLVPDVMDIVSGTARVEDLREVGVADILGRDAVPPDQQLFEACIRGKVVLVTGAGGSIGSELCRQILHLRPSRLMLLEISEVALYTIERELRATCEREGLPIEVVGLLGNAHHKYRVREILQTFGVQTVYHAAAYKHVPIVEQNLIEGLHNNVFSTWYTAEAALECRVETFVLVSTDKAVNPTNVMGATKRFAEIVLQGMQQRSLGTRFCMVRFGNVLESSGSVVPLFREQIRRGGPVTVTHPDVIRYFMTIPEAAQLVIQAGSMATGGDVFVLDMGKPIRIADLARRMITLSGLTVRDADHPEGDIEIKYTGLRPAEKLFEELLIGKNVTGTMHPMIMRAVEHALPWEEVRELLEEVGVAMRRFDCRAARTLLERAVREYRPEIDIQDTVWVRRADAGPAGITDPKVTDLQSRRSRLPLN